MQTVALCPGSQSVRRCSFLLFSSMWLLCWGTERFGTTWQFAGKWKTPEKTFGPLPSAFPSVGVWSELSQLVQAGSMKKHQPVPCRHAHWQDLDSLPLSALKAWADMAPKCAAAFNVQNPQHIILLCAPRPPLPHHYFSLMLSPNDSGEKVFCSVTTHCSCPCEAVCWPVIEGGGWGAFNSDNSSVCCVVRDRLVYEVGFSWCQGTVWIWLTDASSFLTNKVFLVFGLARCVSCKFIMNE